MSLSILNAYYSLRRLIPPRPGLPLLSRVRKNPLTPVGEGVLIGSIYTSAFFPSGTCAGIHCSATPSGGGSIAGAGGRFACKPAACLVHRPSFFC